MEKAEQTILELISHLNQFLMGDEPASLKDLCLKLLLVMSTGVDNVSQGCNSIDIWNLGHKLGCKVWGQIWGPLQY